MGEIAAWHSVTEAGGGCDAKASAFLPVAIALPEGPLAQRRHRGPHAEKISVPSG
jgi:hypothetical protein